MIQSGLKRMETVVTCALYQPINRDLSVAVETISAGRLDLLSFYDNEELLFRISVIYFLLYLKEGKVHVLFLYGIPPPPPLQKKHSGVFVYLFKQTKTNNACQQEQDGWSYRTKLLGQLTGTIFFSCYFLLFSTLTLLKLSLPGDVGMCYIYALDRNKLIVDDMTFNSQYNIILVFDHL